MAVKEILVTAEGLQALEDELEQLKSIKRIDVAEQIRVARGYGDLSENAEYDEAKNEQAQVEGRIREIETMLKHVRVIDHSEISTDTVKVGARVRLLNRTTGKEEEYRIVGSTEADPLHGAISDESPVGRGLLERSLGEEVEIETPGGIITYSIVEISK